MSKKFIFIIIIINLLLSGVQLGVTVLRSTDGPALAADYQKIEQLKLDNWRLQQTISDKSTLAYMEQQADALGLIKITPTYVNSAKVASLSIR